MRSSTASPRAGARGLVLDLTPPADPLPPGWDFVAADVAKESDIEAACRQAAESFGRLDCLVANAGIAPPWRETEAIDLAEWDRVFAVNTRGVMASIKHAVPLMRGAGGSIIVMASVNAITAHPRQMAYTASKHAALGIARAAAQDLGRFAIRVNALAPGPIGTEALLRRLVEREARRRTCCRGSAAALCRDAPGPHGHGGRGGGCRDLPRKRAFRRHHRAIDSRRCRPHLVMPPTN